MVSSLNVIISLPYTKKKKKEKVRIVLEEHKIL